MRAVAVVAAVLAAVLGGAGGEGSVSGYCLGAQCFAVFRDPSDFADAERSCAAHGGSPMTVRSSVAHDALSILLSGSPGRYWIGLHRPLGCPDPAADLRGYQWVTADTESDFHNWAANFDSDCASPRCVSVSERDQFKWAQEPCAERAEGFLCEYSFSEPCDGLEVADGEYVTYTTRLGFEGTDLLSAPPGTTAVRMPAEISYICFDRRWLQAPWACEILGGGCEYECAVDPDNQPFCHCPPGRSVNPDNRVTCELDLTDPCARLRCEHACYEDDDGVHACTCNQGFKLEADARSCADVDECADPRQCPGEHFVCLNSDGAFECVCERGYVSSGALCVDEDECVSAPCEHECANTPGSYNCSCYHGYKADPDAPEKCVLHCGAMECPAECDPNDRYQCFCPDGYIAEERGAQTVCIDIDECAFFYCDQNCRNTFGGYVCSCAPGYKLMDVYRCERDESALTEAPEGSGGGAGTSTSPPAPTEEAAPGPTGRPSAVTPGGLVGIIVCTVFVVVLVVLIAHHVLCRRTRTDSKAPDDTLNL